MQAQPHSYAGLLKRLWFRAPDQAGVLINDVAVRIRAGLLLAIPLYMGFTLMDVVGGSHWVVTGAFIQDTFDTDLDGRILYHVEAVKRTFEYSRQSYILLYALFEMLSGMFKVTSHLSPTILLSSWLARRSRPEWKPLAPKRFAWSIGAALIASCLVFFNPDVFATWVNRLSAHALLPTTANYMPRWVPLVSVWVCIGFMWMEAVLGLCVGCQLHALLVRMGLLKDDCQACNNLRWD